MTTQPIQRLISLLSIMALAAGTGDAMALTHSNKTIPSIRPAGGRVCTLFQLAGISVADPVVNSHWFTIVPTSPGYKEMVATLLAAKAYGSVVAVSTSGGKVWS